MFGVQTQTKGSAPTSIDDTALHGLRIICRDPCAEVTEQNIDFESAPYETLDVQAEGNEADWNVPDVGFDLFSGAEA